MKKFSFVLVLGFALMFGCTAKKIGADNQKVQKETANTVDEMPIGAFSLSLNVKDLQTSREFYENLGFHIKAGSMEQNYLVMKNGNSLIGLFQGMFEGNMLTFNPGWDEDGKEINPFVDVREIEKLLKVKGTELMMGTEEGSKEGPAYIMFQDPDGNMILIDQHR